MSSANTAARAEPSCTIGRTCGVALLNSRLSLFDLHDVERLVGSVISGNKRLHLNPQQYESLTTYVIEEVWRCSLRYDPGRGTAFTTFAYETASRRVLDWLRLEFGRNKWQFADRTIERTQPELVSLDGIESDRLDAAVAAGAGDPADDWSPGLEGLLECGDRQYARDLELLGLEPPRRAA
jgi:DNA-directed RNA polymerase specialized sigma24 family protein